MSNGVSKTKENSYYNIVVDRGIYNHQTINYKPSFSSSALETLQKIKSIISTNCFHALEHNANNDGHVLNNIEKLSELKAISNHILKKYNEKKENLTGLSRIISKIINLLFGLDDKVKNIANEINKYKANPQTTEATSEQKSSEPNVELKNLIQNDITTPSNLTEFYQSNLCGKDRMQETIDMAKKLGFDGETFLEADRYLWELKTEVTLLKDAEIIPAKHLSYKGTFPLRTFDPIKTIDNLRTLNSNEMIEILSNKNLNRIRLDLNGIQPKITKLLYKNTYDTLEATEDKAILAKRSRALGNACADGNKKMCKVLLDMGIDVNGQWDHLYVYDKMPIIGPQTPLGMALRSYYPIDKELIELLVKNGAKITPNIPPCRNPLLRYYYPSENKTEIFNLLNNGNAFLDISAERLAKWKKEVGID